MRKTHELPGTTDDHAADTWRVARSEVLALEVSGISCCALRSERRAAETALVLGADQRPADGSCLDRRSWSACKCLRLYSAVHLVADAMKAEGMRLFWQRHESW
jgi:hypothetical protein